LARQREKRTRVPDSAMAVAARARPAWEPPSAADEEEEDDDMLTVITGSERRPAAGWRVDGDRMPDDGDYRGRWVVEPEARGMEGTVRCLYERTLLRLYYREAAVGVESRWSSFLGLSTGRSYQEIVNESLAQLARGTIVIT
jgi:hypothetical protein